VYKPAKPCGSTLTQGSEGFWEMQAREKAAEQEGAESGNGQAASPPSSVQGARELRQWELEQGIDPSYGSGHERRPFSSSRDAAELEKKYDPAIRKEYVQSVKRYQDNPPWGKKVSPVEKVQNVTEPLSEEMIEVMLEQWLKGSSNPWARAAGLGLKGLGPIADVLLSPKDVW
jgi:hypothetical protein